MDPDIGPNLNGHVLLHWANGINLLHHSLWNYTVAATTLGRVLAGNDYRILRANQVISNGGRIIPCPHVERRESVVAMYKRDLALYHRLISLIREELSHGTSEAVGQMMLEKLTQLPCPAWDCKTVQDILRVV